MTDNQAQEWLLEKGFSHLYFMYQAGDDSSVLRYVGADQPEYIDPDIVDHLRLRLWDTISGAGNGDVYVRDVTYDVALDKFTRSNIRKYIVGDYFSW